MEFIVPDRDKPIEAKFNISMDPMVHRIPEKRGIKYKIGDFAVLVIDKYKPYYLEEEPWGWLITKISEFRQEMETNECSLLDIDKTLDLSDKVVKDEKLLQKYADMFIGYKLTQTMRKYSP